MTESVAACPLCGSSASKHFDRRQFRGQLVSNVICLGCGLVYQSPRMTEAESKAFYEADYRLLYQGQEGPNPKDLSVQAARAQLALDFTRQQVKACTRQLDIGCSAGYLLQKFAGYYHCQVTGVEPSTSYRQYARSQGLSVYASLEEVAGDGRPGFDLVSMMHVLEHLPHPVEYLRNLRVSYLTPTGWLLLEVPNLYAHDCFEVAHLVSFSAHTLVHVVASAGFKIVRLHSHGLPRSRMIPLYLRLLAQPDPAASSSIVPERLVMFKRQLGFLYRRATTRIFPKQAWVEPALLGGK